MTLIKQLQEQTNVDLIFIEIPGDQISEKVNLMFAGRDNPQALFGAASDQNVWNAAQRKDMWSLNDLVDQYAPNWKKAFGEGIDSWILPSSGIP